MYYDPRTQSHGLRHDPYNALVVPRPIGWISTLSADGVVNLAPYSFFNIVANRPPYVMFSSAQRKDSQRNAEHGGEFVVSMATWDLREQVNLTSAAVGADVSEPALAGLAMSPSISVRPPRVANSPIALECTYTKTVELPGANGQVHFCAIVIGAVVGIYISDEVISEGVVDMRRARPISRIGYMDYATLGEIFTMARPAAQG
jgi:flavin reductase (DIM6/NTAB) family NADH-FMN oxidoreductase RutF